MQTGRGGRRFALRYCASGPCTRACSVDWGAFCAYTCWEGPHRHVASGGRAAAEEGPEKLQPRGRQRRFPCNLQQLEQLQLRHLFRAKPPHLFPSIHQLDAAPLSVHLRGVSCAASVTFTTVAAARITVRGSRRGADFFRAGRKSAAKLVRGPASSRRSRRGLEGLQIVNRSVGFNFGMKSIADLHVRR
jgi:hypothetical protein